MTRYERRLAVVASLAILFAGLYAGWALYTGQWNLFVAFVIVGFWAGGCIHQIQLTASYRQMYEHSFCRYNEFRTKYELAVQWNRYMWGELTAIGGHANGYTVAGSYFDPPGPEAGEVIPPEGSAGGS